MSVLEVSKFGLIDGLKMDANKKLNIVIGPQASGKSAIGKVFCTFTKNS